MSEDHRSPAAPDPRRPGAVQPAAGLRAWARGAPAREAGVELLLRVEAGRWAVPGSPWLRPHRPGPHPPGEPAGSWVSEGLVEVDVDQLVASAGPMPARPARLLAVVAALLSPAHPVALGEVLTGAPPRDAVLILAAVAHAAADRHRITAAPGGAIGYAPATPHPWPTD